MKATGHMPPGRNKLKIYSYKLWVSYRQVPILGWMLGMLASTLLETFLGTYLALNLGMSDVPALFGFTVVLKHPVLITSVIIYLLVIYILPVAIVARLTRSLTNYIANKLMKYPFWISAIIHIALLYVVINTWAVVGDYRVLLTKLIMIAIIITLSLNIINGYMGEFSCSHPGFIALGAYTASIMTVLFFVNDSVFGAALLPPALAPFLFPVILIFGGAIASLFSLLVAIPAFETRGDYLAIISLAFTFIIKSLLENLEIFGGARGFMNQPDLATLPVVFLWTVLSVWIINNFVRSTFGKALNAVRDNETAANAMTVNTKKTKMIAFMFASFWAGIAGGLFAHVMRYVNPGSFGIKKLAEVLAMVYFGGLNSVIGSIVGAVGFSLLSEMLRPLQIFKWIIIPLLLILVMIFRPTGLIAFREFDPEKLLRAKNKMEEDK